MTSVLTERENVDTDTEGRRCEDSCQRKPAERPGLGFSESSQREPADGLTLDFWPQGCERADTPCRRHLLCGAVSSSPGNWDVPGAETVRASPHQMLGMQDSPAAVGSLRSDQTGRGGFLFLKEGGPTGGKGLRLPEGCRTSLRTWKLQEEGFCFSSTKTKPFLPSQAPPVRGREWELGPLGGVAAGGSPILLAG